MMWNIVQVSNRSPDSTWVLQFKRFSIKLKPPNQVMSKSCIFTQDSGMVSRVPKLHCSLSCYITVGCVTQNSSCWIWLCSHWAAIWWGDRLSMIPWRRLPTKYFLTLTLMVFLPVCLPCYHYIRLSYLSAVVPRLARERGGMINSCAVWQVE
jgi:hypothetical protein